jgi:hypothetical protein
MRKRENYWERGGLEDFSKEKIYIYRILYGN